MNRTVAQMKSVVGNNVQDTSVDLALLIEGWLGDRYVEVKRRTNWENTARYGATISVSAGAQELLLPDDADKIVSLYDGTNKSNVTPTTIGETMRDHESDLSNAATVCEYTNVDDTVRTQNTVAAVVTLASSSASDTTQTIFIRGLSGGRQLTEQLSLNGTSTVTGTIVWDIGGLRAFSKTATTIGTVTISGGGSVTLAAMAPNALTSRIKKIRLVQPAISALTLQLTYIPKPIDLSNDYDYPELECEDILEAWATSDAWKYKKQFAKADYWEGIGEKRIQDLIWSIVNQPNQTHFFNPQPYPRDNC